MRRLASTALLLALAACNEPDTAPQTQVDRLRVLSVRADPPEIAPGQATTLAPLVGAPGIDQMGDATAPQTVCLRGGQPSWDRLASGGCAAGAIEAPIVRLWFSCEPTPETVSNNPCTSVDNLASPGDLITSGAVGQLSASTTYSPTPPDPALFDGLPPDSVVRRHGVLMVVGLIVAVDVDGDLAAGRLDALQQKIEANTIPNLLALKRVNVLDDPTNHDPRPAALKSVEGDLHDGDPAGWREPLDLRYDADPRESWTQVNVDGTTEQRTEQLVASWFSGFGRFDKERTLFGEKTTYFPAGGKGIDQPPPGSDPEYTMPLGAVVRDGRGGEGWIVITVRVKRHL